MPFGSQVWIGMTRKFWGTADEMKLHDAHHEMTQVTESNTIQISRKKSYWETKKKMVASAVSGGIDRSGLNLDINAKRLKKIYRHVERLCVT